MLLFGAAVLYQGLCKPLKRRKLNRLQLFNDSILSLCTASMVIFTDLIPDVTMRYELGWLYVALIGF